MTEEEREAVYDSEIAPVLKDLGAKCEAAGLSLVAVAEWAPGETGLTATIATDHGIGLDMVHWAAQCHGNADSLILAMMRHAAKRGHNSACLHQLGVPNSPAPTINTREGE